MIDIIKTKINIGTIGHVDHGKTTFSAAISKMASKISGTEVKNYQEIDNAPEEKARGITINAKTIEVGTVRRLYSLTDCPGHASFMKNMLVGVNNLDCVILILSGIDSIEPQTKAHLEVASRIGINKIIVFINKMDVEGTADFVDIVISDITQHMEKLGYGNPVEIPEAFYNDINNFEKDNSSLFTHENKKEFVIVKGSAMLALNDDQSEFGEPAIKTVLKLLDDFIPNPDRKLDAPFLLNIEDCYNIKGRGVVVTGKVMSGVCKEGDTLQITGLGYNFSNPVTSMESFKKPAKEVKAGDNVGILMRGLTNEAVSRGAVLCTPNYCQESKFFKGNAYFFGNDESADNKSSDKKSYRTGYEPVFFINTASITGKIYFLDEKGNVDYSKVVFEGDENVPMIVELFTPVALSKNPDATHIYVVKEGTSVRASGVIGELLSIKSIDSIPSVNKDKTAAAEN